MCGIMFCKDLCTRVLHMNAIFILFFLLTSDLSFDKSFNSWHCCYRARFMYNTLLKLRFSAFLYCIEAELKRFVAVIKF